MQCCNQHYVMLSLAILSPSGYIGWILEIPGKNYQIQRQNQTANKKSLQLYLQTKLQVYMNVHNDNIKK